MRQSKQNKFQGENIATFLNRSRTIGKTVSMNFVREINNEELIELKRVYKTSKRETEKQSVIELMVYY